MTGSVLGMHLLRSCLQLPRAAAPRGLRSHEVPRGPTRPTGSQIPLRAGHHALRVGQYRCYVRFIVRFCVAPMSASSSGFYIRPLVRANARSPVRVRDCAALPQTEAVPKLCAGKFHCRLPHSDDGQYSKQARPVSALLSALLSPPSPSPVRSSAIHAPILASLP